MNIQITDYEKRIYEYAIKAGYDDCGIIPIEDTEEYNQQLNQRMEKSPESSYFYSNFTEVMNTKKQFPWAKSVIICTYYYGQYRYPKELQGKYAKAFFLSPESNKNGNDYKRKIHFINDVENLGIKIQGGEQFISHVQVGGLRNMAAKAGLGIIRNNNFLYTEKGSWVGLDGFVIDKELTLYQHHNIKPCSDKCTICRKNCPTGCLSDIRTMNPFRCISFINTFGHNKLPEDINETQIGSWIIGCDACQDCCPHNRHDWDKGTEFPGLKNLVAVLEPHNLSKETDEKIQELIVPRTTEHIAPTEVETLRERARRYIRNASK